MKIAIASGKGGTGKTTLSTNLTDFLAKKNKGKKIILVDLDVEEPNSGLFIKGRQSKKNEKFKMIPKWNKEECTACGKCGSVCNYNAVLLLGKTVMIMSELCHSCFACSGLCPTNALPMVEQRMGETKNYKTQNMTFIESRLDIGQEQAVPLIAQTIEEVEKEVKDSKNSLIFFDSPPGTSCPVIEVCKNSDFVILVTEPTPFGLHDLSLAVNTMREIKKECAVVINRYGIGNEEVLAFCKREKIEIIGKLPNDRKIAEVYSSGNMVYEQFPAFKSELIKISDYLLQKCHEEEL